MSDAKPIKLFALPTDDRLHLCKPCPILRCSSAALVVENAGGISLCKVPGPPASHQNNSIPAPATEILVSPAQEYHQISLTQHILYGERAFQGVLKDGVVSPWSNDENSLSSIPPIAIWDSPAPKTLFCSTSSLFPWAATYNTLCIAVATLCVSFSAQYSKCQDVHCRQLSAR